MTSPWTDLERPPLSAHRLSRALSAVSLCTQLRVLDQTESTNAVAATAARRGVPEGLVVIAEHQTGGRGRLDRTWTAPPRSGLLMSVLLRPAIDLAAWPLIPLLAGLAVAEAVAAVAGITTSLKWPNDILAHERKLAGILAERVEHALVVGVGVNVSLREDELPVGGATSLAIAGGVTDRESLAKEVVRSLDRRYVAFRDTPGAAAGMLAAYRERCGTIDRKVRVELPGGDTLAGRAVAVDDDGRLVVRADGNGERRTFSAGDVVHVRGDG